MSTSTVTQTWGISLKIYLSVLHPSHTAHFPQKSLYLSLISPRQSSWQSKLRRSLCTLTSSLRIQIFFQKVKQYTQADIRDENLTWSHFNDKFICWRADRWHQRRVSRPPPPPLPRFPPPSPTPKFFFLYIYALPGPLHSNSFYFFLGQHRLQKPQKNKTLWERIFERRCTTKNRTRFAREDIGLCSFCGSTVKEWGQNTLTLIVLRQN